MNKVPWQRLLSTVTHHASKADRELALPITFLSASKWSRQPASDWSPWIRNCTSLGYSCSAIDVEPLETSLDSFENELKQEIRKGVSPFPPLLFARGVETLIAQTYVSSHPLSGLVLVEPPLSIEEALRRKDIDLKGNPPEFDYEPFFPIAILCRRPHAEALERHRLRSEYPDDVHLLATPEEDVLSQDAFEWVSSEWVREDLDR